MRALNIHRLAMGKGSVSMKDFARGFPDQRAYCRRFGVDGRRWSDVDAVFKRLGFTGPPELLTMHLCVLGSALQKFKSEKALEKALLATRKKLHLWAHPLELMTACE